MIINKEKVIETETIVCDITGRVIAEHEIVTKALYHSATLCQEGFDLVPHGLRNHISIAIQHKDRLSELWRGTWLFVFRSYWKTELLVKCEQDHLVEMEKIKNDHSYDSTILVLQEGELLGTYTVKKKVKLKKV